MSRKIELRINKEWMVRFERGLELFLDKYFADGDGPCLREFVLLCAQVACSDLITELDPSFWTEDDPCYPIASECVANYFEESFYET